MVDNTSNSSIEERPERDNEPTMVNSRPASVTEELPTVVVETETSATPTTSATTETAVSPHPNQATEGQEEQTSSSTSTSSPAIVYDPRPYAGICNPFEEGEEAQQDARIWFSGTSVERPNVCPMAGTATDSGAAIMHTQDPSLPLGWTPVSQRRRRIQRDRIGRMQSQLKDLHGQHGQWTCFLCCHVRTGTIFIGFWHMILYLMALSLIAVVVVHPEILSQVRSTALEKEKLQRSRTAQDVQAVNCAEMPCLLAAQGDGDAKTKHVPPDFSLSVGNIVSTHWLSDEEINAAFFITLCTFVVTLLLVYGAFRGYPAYLMPFFFLQVFDFCISSMTMVGYISYLPNVRQLIRETPTFPFQRQLLAMNTKCLTFFVMLVFITTFMIKAYCINIVWRCYRFLLQHGQGRRWVVRSRINGSCPVDQESQTLVVGQDLPDYNTAIADPQYRKKLSTLFPEPPPSYDMAMAALQAQEQVLAQVNQAQREHASCNISHPQQHATSTAAIAARCMQQQSASSNGTQTVLTTSTASTSASA